LNVIQENVVTDPTFFSKFRLRNQTLGWNFWNFTSKFQSCNLQLITFPKRYFASKSTNKWLRYHQKKVEKHAEIQKNLGFLTDFLFAFWEKSNVFQPSFKHISAICWPIWMENSVLERLLVVDYMTKVWIWNFKNFIPKLGSEVEIWWKKRDLWPHFLE
jgi:hypothetical protein